MATTEEKQALLGPSTGAGVNPTASLPPDYNEQPPPYTEGPTEEPYVSPGHIHPGSPSSGQAPPPYPSSPGQTLFVQCRVCQQVIHVPQGTSSRVIKCSQCHEATPIAAPPPGKKYVRCPCNCLLTCSATASRVICPRQNCRRTIGVGTIQVRPNVNLQRVRVNCGHCNRSILWPANAPVARCPHCRHRSFLHREWMRNRAIFCLVLGLLFLLAGGIVTGVTLGVAMTQGGVYVISVGFFVSGIALLIRAVFYCAMTQSSHDVV